MGVQQRPPVFHAGQAAGDFGEIVPARPLLGEGKGAVVCGDGVDLAAPQGRPQGL